MLSLLDSRKISVYSVFLILLLLVPVWLFGCSADDRTEGEALLWTPETNTSSQNKNANLVEVSTGTVSRVVSGEGILVYPKNETITCDFNNARLVSVNVKKGETVKKGDIIARFTIEYNESDLTSLESELSIFEKQHKAGLLSYKNGVAIAESQLRDIQDEYEKNPSDYLRIQVAKAEIQLKKAKATLDFYEYENSRKIRSLERSIEDFKQRIEDDTVYAPFDGIIGNIDYLPVGNIITPGSSICYMYATDSVWIATNSDISNGMRYNAPAEIEISVPKETYSGRIITAPDVFGNHTGRVVIIPDSPIEIDTNNRLRRITVKASRYSLENVLTLPSKVIYNEDGKRFVYLYEDGFSKKRYVTLGLSALNTVQILDGLSEGQWVVAN